jgi:hypothetical protein
MTFSLIDELNFLSTYKLSEQTLQTPSSSPPKKHYQIQALHKFQLEDNGQWGQVSSYMFITLKGEKKHIMADNKGNV